MVAINDGVDGNPLPSMMATVAINDGMDGNGCHHGWQWLPSSMATVAVIAINDLCVCVLVCWRACVLLCLCACVLVCLCVGVLVCLCASWHGWQLIAIMMATGHHP